MREIKFRLWNKEIKEMLFSDSGENDESREFHPFVFHIGYKSPHKLYDFEIMQFTGLVDKNGKEIYEGDKLTILFGEEMYTGGKAKHEGVEVFWNDIELCWSIKNPNSLIRDMQLGAYVSGEFEVIGNIYENNL
jgi:uncharacterized phage protein (TIGR01671 family)